MTPTTETTTHVLVHGRRLKVSVRPGEGIPLVLCHGFGTSMELFDPFVEALDSSIPVVRFDAPGMGGSQLPRAPYTIASLARSLGRVLTELGLDRVDVLGMSWGGGLAQQFALQNPKRCRRLVLVSTSTGWTMVPGDPRAGVALSIPRSWRRLAGFSSAGPLFGGAIRRDPDIARRIYATHRVTARGSLLQLTAATGWTSLPFLPMLRQQTLILAGTDDPITPLANARILHAGLPHSELVTFDDGHLGLVVLADELSARIARFVRP